MVKFIKNRRAKSELEAIIHRIVSNMANNYKDAAQEAFREYEAKFNELLEGGMLSDRQRLYYEVKLSEYRVAMNGFSHKDQKATWT